MKNYVRQLTHAGRAYAINYGIMLWLVMTHSIVLIGYYILCLTIAVPIVGAFKRTPKLQWRLFALSSLTLAILFQLFQYLQEGINGLPFYSDADFSGFGHYQFNDLSLLIVLLIFLPLSASCAISRVRMRRRTKVK